MRSRAPVFVVGCPRSGTSHLAGVLVSAGGFARYRAETHFYDMVVPKYGSLRSARARECLLDWWVGSRQFERSGLDEATFKSRVRVECRSDGDFLRLFMGGMADFQGVPRWLDSTPAHLLHMRRIKQAIPDALFVHIIRDGRDVALSLSRMGWATPPPWERGNPLLIAAWSWAWEVKLGRHLGRYLEADYLEVRFEDLISQREKTVATIAEFAGLDSDLSGIEDQTPDSVHPPNTSFPEELKGGTFNPIGRWREQFPANTLSVVEASVGDLLLELGYEVPGALNEGARPGVRARLRAYEAYRSLRHWLKCNTAFSRVFVDTHL